MNVLRKVLSISAAILLLSATAKAQDAGNGAEQQRLFDYPEVPDTIITLENRTNYIIQNFWNDYDFSQPIRDERVFEATFRDYVTFFKYAHKTIVVSCIKDMMRKAQSNKSNFLLIAEIAERTLYDPGAEYWSDEVYIPFLESVLDNNMLKKSEQERYKYQLELLRNNLMGDRAQDFELRLADGSKKKLSEIEGKMLLEENTVAGRTGWFSGGPLKGAEYQFRRLGIRAEDVKWDAAGGEYVVERDGQFYALEEDEDFYELKPLKGSKRNFEERD